MHILFNSFSGNALELRNKITGLTPLEKKVALIAVAFFALAALWYFVAQNCHTSQGTKCLKEADKVAKKAENIPQQELFEKKDLLADLRETYPELIQGPENEPLQAIITIDHADKNLFQQSDSSKGEDPPMQEVENVVPQMPVERDELQADVTDEHFEEIGGLEEGPSEYSIAVNNSDIFRRLINDLSADELEPSVQLRTLYLDQKGGLRGISSISGDPVWLDGKSEPKTYEMKIKFKTFGWDIRKPLFSLQEEGGNYPMGISDVAASMLSELNQMALGAYHVALEDKKILPLPRGPLWLVVFENVQKYSAEYLLGHAPSENQSPRLDPRWINAHPEQPWGFESYEELKDFVTEHGDRLKTLHLKGHRLSHEEFIELVTLCPDLTHVYSESSIDNSTLASLQGIPLASVTFTQCGDLTNQGLAYLKGLPLESIDLRHAKNLTDEALEHLQGMPLKKVSLKAFDLLSDKGIEYLKEMHLEAINLNYCYQLTDKTLQHLSGMPLSRVSFLWCSRLTSQGLEHLKGMPLTCVNFNFCRQLTDEAIAHLQGMQLTSVSFNSCQITDKAFEYLQEMPLKTIDFSFCDLTEKAFETIQGMKLIQVKCCRCKNLTDKALEYLKGMALICVDFSGCVKLTDQGIKHLQGMPLRKIAFGDCIELTDQAFEVFAEMPLEFISFSRCVKLTDKALDYLKEKKLRYACFFECPNVLDDRVEQITAKWV